MSDPLLFVVDDDAVTLASLAGALETSVPDVFATGDVRDGSVKRLAPAVGQGRSPSTRSTSISAMGAPTLRHVRARPDLPTIGLVTS